MAAPNPMQQETRHLRFFLTGAILATGLCVSGGFLGMALKDRRLIQDEMVQRARRDFRVIVLTRKWNAQYGGVYVEKRPGVESNPYLRNPDITDLQGRQYTKKNPALMTRELSELMQQSDGHGFRITSLRPVNPKNAPDPMEAEALKSFEGGVAERHWMEPRPSGTMLRYMAPLKVETPCLECHAEHGYRLGEIRGGISVSYPVGELRDKLQRNLLVIGALALSTTSLLLGLIGMLFRRLVRKLRQAREQLVVLASTDGLTGLLNRRTVLLRLDEELARHLRSGLALCVALIDVDHFKQVNDVHGHLVGDEVLRSVAAQLRQSVRTYDGVGRYGGEEFLVLLPDTDLEHAECVGERIREAIQAQVRAGTTPVTASLGLAEWREGESSDAFLNRADHALYTAKASGRNRLEIDR